MWHLEKWPKVFKNHMALILYLPSSVYILIYFKFLQKKNINNLCSSDIFLGKYKSEIVQLGKWGFSTGITCQKNVFLM